MRKTIYLLLLCATSLLFSCLEDDNNTYSNTVIKETPVTWRPNWTKVNNVLIYNQPLSILGCQ